MSALLTMSSLPILCLYFTFSVSATLRSPFNTATSLLSHSVIPDPLSYSQLKEKTNVMDVLPSHTLDNLLIEHDYGLLYDFLH